MSKVEKLKEIENLLKTGTLEPVASVAQRKTGKRPPPATIWRWCRKGLRGGKVKLAAAFHGGSWCTTDAAFDAFIAAQTATQQMRHGSHAPVGCDDDALRDAGLL